MIAMTTSKAMRVNPPRRMFGNPRSSEMAPLKGSSCYDDWLHNSPALPRLDVGFTASLPHSATHRSRRPEPAGCKVGSNHRSLQIRNVPLAGAGKLAEADNLGSCISGPRGRSAHLPFSFRGAANPLSARGSKRHPGNCVRDATNPSEIPPRTRLRTACKHPRRLPLPLLDAWAPQLFNNLLARLSGQGSNPWFRTPQRSLTRASRTALTSGWARTYAYSAPIALMSVSS